MAVNRQLAATLGLLTVTAVWGSSFITIKQLLADMTPINLLGIRFLIGGVLVALIYIRTLMRASARTWMHGAIIGAVYGIAQIFQTMGLAHTEASVAGFITGGYVVMTPLFAWLILKQRIMPITILATGIAALGIVVLSFHGMSFGYGEALTFCGAVLYAIHICIIGYWVNRENALQLAVIQIIVIGIICFAGALPFGISLPSTPYNWAIMMYIVLFAAVGALMLQTWAQNYISAPRAAIMLTMEPVFATIFAVILGGEAVTARLVVGGGMIFSAMLITEGYTAWKTRRIIQIRDSQIDSYDSIESDDEGEDGQAKPHSA